MRPQQRDGGGIGAGRGGTGGASSGGGDTVADLGEFRLIDRVTADRNQPPSTVLGPGDDAAVVAAADGRVVAATDVLVEGVHFRLDWSTPEQVGRKAVAVNMIDVAAMGAVPTALLIGLGCPPDTPLKVVDGLATGMWRETEAAGAGIVGGDMVTAEQLVISVTALGDLGGGEPVTRAGARAGDVVAVCGRLGWAAAGLAVLGRGFRSPATVVNAHRAPEPPYAAGPAAAQAGATSMIDVSDGLLADLGHIARASRVGMDIRTGAMPVHERVLDVAAALGADPVRWVLTGGEDYALAATFPSARSVPPTWTVIGDVLPGTGVLVDGGEYAQEDAGWQHWRG